MIHFSVGCLELPSPGLSVLLFVIRTQAGEEFLFSLGGLAKKLSFLWIVTISDHLTTTSSFSVPSQLYWDPFSLECWNIP